MYRRQPPTPAQENEIFWQEAERRQRIKDGMI